MRRFAASDLVMHCLPMSTKRKIYLYGLMQKELISKALTVLKLYTCLNYSEGSAVAQW